MARCDDCGQRLSALWGKTYHRDFLLVRDLAADIKQIARLQADPKLYEMAAKGELYARALHDKAHGTQAAMPAVGVSFWRGRASSVVAKNAALLDGEIDGLHGDDR